MFLLLFAEEMTGLKSRNKVLNGTFPFNSCGTAECHGINLWVINMLMEGRIKKRAGCGTQMGQRPEANNFVLIPILKNRFKAEIRTISKVFMWSSVVTSQVRLFLCSGTGEADV